VASNKQADDEPSANSRVSLTEILQLSAGEDIEALAFTVLMDAAKSAREDLKQIMAEVKARNAAKQRLRELICRMNRDVVASAVAAAQGKDVVFAPNGLGGERAYHRVEIPVPDPESQGGVQIAVVSLVDAKITSLRDLEAALDAVKDKRDSLSELSEEMQLRLQLLMDRYAKLEQVLSNVLRRISDTQQSIIDNLK
jgi:hypothetical protein